MKKIAISILTCILIFSHNIYSNTNLMNGIILETNSEVSEEIKIYSKIALIYDRASGTILYEKNGNLETPMASTTKIMTAIVVLENANLSDIVEIDKQAASVGGSVLGVKTGDKITVNDLLYGLMLCSGNDAAIALANYIGGSVEGFSDMMNQKVRELRTYK